MERPCNLPDLFAAVAVSPIREDATMSTTTLSIHSGLAGSSRLPALAQQNHRVLGAEMLLLFSAGVAAALASAVPSLWNWPEKV